MTSITRSRLYACACALVCLGLAVSPAQAEGLGFIDAIRNALFGKPIPEPKQPTYSSLPRERLSPVRPASPSGRGFEVLRAGGSAAPITPIRSGATAALRGTGTACVRLCDGYVFPMSPMRSAADAPALQAACAASCPGTPTSLFRLSGGASVSKPDRARSVEDGTLYRALKTAFLFRREHVASCSCQGPDNIAARTPILADPTLRRGDIVVSATGHARVFAGTTTARHDPRDFQGFKGNPALTRTAQRDLDRVMGVSLKEARAREVEQRFKVVQLETPTVPATTARAEPAIARAYLQPAAAPAGTAPGVRAFTVVSGGTAAIRPVSASASASGPAIYVIR
ncbi:MAG: DUF2865 domain-containing protein [Methylobacteriaceae bacterium]|nr:DUF2865 domain-containing protein [Methylobacteriaceae bacterium]